MRSKGTLVLLFYVVATLLVMLVFNLALSESFAYFRKEDVAILGPRFTMCTLIALILASSIAIYAGFINKKARNFIEQCVVELDKVAWPSWHETKIATYTVIVTSLVASVILGLFDGVFGWLTNHNLFLG
jgi:preprotein translocase SecE subunit